MSVANLNYALANPISPHEPHDYYAKKLSKDKPCEYKNGGYIIYANDSRWFFINFVTWELYWFPYSMGNDLDGVNKLSWLEFKSTWLPRHKMFKLIKRIIYTHPNLETKGVWRIIKFFNS